MSERRVEFILGGVQRSGTTTLFEYLGRHPRMAAPRHKEPHFFDDESVDWSSPDYSVYHGHFSDHDGVRFEATPIYIYWPGSLERIASYNPDMKLGFIFRDPIERAWSQWCLEYARNNEMLDFRCAILSEPERLAGLSPTDPSRRVHSYVDRGFYGRQVRHLLGIFPRHQLLFLSHADLKRRPAAVLDRLAGFLGIAAFAEVAPIAANRRPAIAYPSSPEAADVEYLRACYRQDLAAFARLTGIDVADWPTMRTGYGR